MKKLVILLISLLLIAGCSADSSINVSDADTVLFEVNGKAYTKGEFYKTLTAGDYSSTVLADMKAKLAEAEEIDLSELEEEANDYYEYIAAYGDYYVSYYGGKDAIIESYKSYGIDTVLCKEYLRQNMDEYVESYSPFKAQFAYFETKEQAEELIKMVNEGSNFEMAAAELGYEFESLEAVYSERDTTLNGEVRTYCLNSENTGISDVIVSSSSTSDAEGNAVLTATYYVVNLTSKDVTEFEDEFVAYMTDNSYIDSNVALNMLLKKHDVNIHVQDIYDTLSSTYEALEIK